jgi:hypothetical protein
VTYECLQHQKKLLGKHGTNLAGEFLSPSLVESGYWKFNHSRQAAAIKFARRSWRAVFSTGTGSCEIEPMSIDGDKADLGTIDPKARPEIMQQFQLNKSS